MCSGVCTPQKHTSTSYMQTVHASSTSAELLGIEKQKEEREAIETCPREVLVVPVTLLLSFLSFCLTGPSREKKEKFVRPFHVEFVDPLLPLNARSPSIYTAILKSSPSAFQEDKQRRTRRSHAQIEIHTGSGGRRHGKEGREESKETSLAHKRNKNHPHS